MGEQGSYNLFPPHRLNFYLLLHRNFLSAARTARASLASRRGKSKWLFPRLTWRLRSHYYLRNFPTLTFLSRRLMAPLTR